MARSLFTIIDLIDDVRKSWQTDINECSENQIGLINTIESQLLQFLDNYDIKIIRHKINTPFNAGLMRPVSTIPTDDKNLDQHISESLQAGFLWGKYNLLRPEKVKLYKYESVNINLIKEGGVL
jgi:molecular chaperone GrpE (heat shock protein)